MLRFLKNKRGVRKQRPPPPARLKLSRILFGIILDIMQCSREKFKFPTRIDRLVTFGAQIESQTDYFRVLAAKARCVQNSRHVEVIERLFVALGHCSSVQPKAPTYEKSQFK